MLMTTTIRAIPLRHKWSRICLKAFLRNFSVARPAQQGLS
eukprot:IDg22023t1